MAENAQPRVFLVVVDETAEHHLALQYAARRAAQDAWGKKPITRVLVTEL